MRRLHFLVLSTVIVTASVWGADVLADPLATPATAPPAAAARQGVIVRSDGSELRGAMTLTSGARLQFHDGKRLRDLDPASVAAISFSPDSESLARAFAMPEPGRPIKVETGEPYPLRTLRARVALTDGTVIDGHLYATAVVIEDAEGRHRVPLPAKQRGEPGQSLASLVYPLRLAWTAPGGGPASAAACTVTVAGGADDLGAVALADLAPLAVSRQAEDRFTIASVLGSPLLLARRRMTAVAVAAPAGDLALAARLQPLVEQLNEFFDGRQVVHAWQDGETIYSIVLLHRIAATTDGARRPWHVDAWRWRLDGDRALIAARSTILRGLGAPPTVAVGSAGWRREAVNALLWEDNQ